MDSIEIIQESDLGRDLTQEEVAKLAAVAVEKECSDGELIIKEGDTTRDVFLIVDGWVSVEIQQYSSELSVPKLQLLKNRGIVGEFSFVDGSRRSANVKAKDKVWLLMLPYEEMENVLKSEPRMGYIVMRNIAVQLCSRIRNANTELSNQLIW